MSMLESNKKEQSRGKNIDAYREEDLLSKNCLCDVLHVITAGNSRLISTWYYEFLPPINHQT